jgi:alpha-N-arabinofuranosidase
VTLLLEGIVAASAAGTVLTGNAIDAHNTFEDPKQVRPAALEVKTGNGAVSVELPPRSVSVITVQE